MGLGNFKELITITKAECEAPASKKELWLLCPARGGLALRAEALGSRPVSLRDRDWLSGHGGTKVTRRHKATQIEQSQDGDASLFTL